MKSPAEPSPAAEGPPASSGVDAPGTPVNHSIVIEGSAAQGAGPARRRSLKTNSAARLASDVSALAFSIVAATVTARLLGPAGKGYYSSLLLLGGIFVVAFSAGLGEAAIVLTGRGRFPRDTAFPATVLAVAGLSVAGALLFVGVAYVAVGAETSNDRVAILLGGVLTGVNVQYNTMAAFLLEQERVVTVAVLAIVAAGSSTITLWVLVAVGHLGTAGAILGGIVGSVIALAGTLAFLRGSDVRLRPRWSSTYLRSAIAFGASLQVSNLLVLMTARVDLIFVYRLSGAAEAGFYSVALTIGTIVAAVPTALSYASFPRLANIDDEEAQKLVPQLFRVGMVAATVCGLALLLTTPIVVPLAFGTDFSAAVVPTLLLIPGGILWSGQWILCRASAARGRPRPLLVSFLVSCGTMVALDLVLISPFGGIGAALASLIASAVGLLISVHFCRQQGWIWSQMVPRIDDLSAFVHEIKRIASPLRR